MKRFLAIGLACLTGCFALPAKDAFEYATPAEQAAADAVVAADAAGDAVDGGDAAADAGDAIADVLDTGEDVTALDALDVQLADVPPEVDAPDADAQAADDGTDAVLADEVAEIVDAVDAADVTVADVGPDVIAVPDVLADATDDVPLDAPDLVDAVDDSGPDVADVVDQADDGAAAGTDAEAPDAADADDAVQTDAVDAVPADDTSADAADDVAAPDVITDLCAGVTCPALVCKTNTCDPGTGQCVAVTLPSGATCEDGSLCTSGDQCVGGSCFGGGATNCSDGNACTDDSCAPLTGCAHVGNDANACSDGSVCTADACVDGVCSAKAIDADGDSYGPGAACGGDCNDGNVAVHPGVVEVCNGVDDNCDGQTDEPGAAMCTVYWKDADKDGFGGSPATGGENQCLCKALDVYTAVTATDCNDASAQVNPTAVEICDGLDNDCNGKTDETCDVDKDGYCAANAVIVSGTKACKYQGVDCDDGNPKIHPGQPEVCGNSIDDDCDGQTDSGATDAVGCSLYYEDGDKDGVGTFNSQCLCAPGGIFTSTTSGDCNDSNKNVYPGNKEVCGNGVDDNCNGKQDEEGALNCSSFYKDADQDGYGAGKAACLCAPSATYNTANGNDCNDNDPKMNPAMTEVCNNIDDNCDGATDNNNPLGCSNFYVDADKDGFGVEAQALCLCASSGTYTATIGGDCDDSKSGINPVAVEVCDFLDNNCNGLTDDGLGTSTYYQDADVDGYGVTATGVVLCGPDAAHPTVIGGDCDDLNAAIKPGATEICDGADNNCDKQSFVSITDVTIPGLATPGTNSLNNWVAQGVKAVNAGTLESVTFWLNTVGAAATLDLYVYKGGMPGIGTQVAKVTKSVTSTGLTAQTFTLPVGVVALSAGEVYYVILHPQAVVISATFERNTSGTSDATSAHVGGYASAAAVSITGTYTAFGTTGAFNVDVRLTTLMLVAAGVTVDEGCDDDADLYCDKAMSITSTATCTASAKPPVGSTQFGDDCNDTNSAVKPSANEICDGIDNNCDAITDPPGSSGSVTFYADLDSDGYGAGPGTAQCGAGYGKTTMVAGDCNDGSAAINPGQAEVCGNAIDDNCNGQLDEGCTPAGMVLIPAGTFWMGCNATKDTNCSSYSQESPQHKVTLSAYYMDLTETTVTQYKACVDAAVCTAPSTGSYATYPSLPNNPVNYVTWTQSQAYCKWRGAAYDLPTEAQWEMAARGSCEKNGSTAGDAGCAAAMRTYPWGETPPTASYAVISGSAGTATVGSIPAGDSPYGLHDMAGNVYEWNRDWYSSTYYGSSPATDPYDSASASARVARGGNFNDTAVYLRAGYRYSTTPSGAYSSFGLRCVRSYP